MVTIATLYEIQAMVDGPKLPARAYNVKTEFNFIAILAMSKNDKYPYNCFLNPRINKHFNVNQGFLVFKAN